MSLDPASGYLREARALMAQGVGEHPLRALLQQHLPLLFPDRPWWVRHHAHGVESHTRTLRGTTLGSGFIDALVGATVIEYEPNLARAGVEEHARMQVREYVAGQLNAGVRVDIIRGIVSDTLRWLAFEPVVEASKQPPFGSDDVTLTVIDRLDLTTKTPTEGSDLRSFLLRHLGRIGARPLDADRLADDLGLGSEFGAERRKALADVYARKAEADPDYAEMISRLWSELVDAIGSSGSRSFGVNEYIDEFYLITLAKLICANVLDPVKIGRPEAQLMAILRGDFFSARSLPNYVEYDLFGWLSDDPKATGLLPVALDIQFDLLAYDFEGRIDGDIFGRLLANLGSSHTRLILGQELTPPWLAEALVTELASRLNDEPMRLLDTACGSGAMLVQGLAAERGRIPEGTPDRDVAIRLLGAVTGFDIDPLATLLAKTNWVIAMRDHLDHLRDVTIPIFNADSLFAGLHGDNDAFLLKLDEQYVRPPTSLLDARGRPVFDAVLSKVYDIAMDQAKRSGRPDTSAASDVAHSALAEAPADHAHDTAEIAAFASTLIAQIALLQRRRRNGLWLYVIRNISRAAQSSSQFNALAINPPWLALSKIGDNPYRVMLARLARDLGVQPAAQSFLHTEMSTVFLLEGVRRYLAPGGVFGCVLPGAIVNGNHQNRFRSGAYTVAPRRVDMNVDTVWQIEPSPFKNQAVVLFGARTPPKAKTVIPGSIVNETSTKSRPLRVITATYPSQPDRVIWTASEGSGTIGFGVEAAPFRQGADIMPRTAWFHDVKWLPNGRAEIGPAIDNPALRHLVADAKVSRDLKAPPGPVGGEFLFKALLSQHLTPFHVASPADVLLPARFDRGGWCGADGTRFTLAGAGTRQVFETIAHALGRTLDRLFEVVDERRKLRQQTWPTDSFLVLSGAGGANPCAAWIGPEVATSGLLTIDQTLYWVAVETKAEAAYLAGAINSPRCAALVAPFQPEGQQGKRHVHKLPFGVTPSFDPNDPAHMRLAAATMAIKAALEAAADEVAAVAEARLPAGGSLAHRRKKIMAAIQQTSEWPEYEAASSAIYDV